MLRLLLKWMSRWSLASLHRLGAGLGEASYRLSPTYRRRFDAAVAQAGVAPAAARGAVREAGRMVAELPRLWLGEAATLVQHCEGSQRVDAALAEGRGLLILTPHLGCFEVCAQAFAQRWGAQHPITVLYRPARQPWLRELVASSRDRPGLRAVPADLGGVRQMMRALKRGEVVGLLPDQVPPEGMGVWAPFFGREAYTMTLATRLAQQSGAALLLCWGERLPGGRGYVVHFEPFGESLPREVQAQAESAAVINRAMERLILQAPHQYLWGYHRYKAPRLAAPEADSSTPH